MTSTAKMATTRTEWCPTCGHKILVDGDDPPTCSYCAQSDTGQPEREGYTPTPWTYGHYSGKEKGFYINSVPALDDAGLQFRVADRKYGREYGGREQAEADMRLIVTAVNSHASLIAALERTQKFLLLLTDAGVLDQIAAEHSHPDEVNGLCDAVGEALKHARERE